MILRTVYLLHRLCSATNYDQAFYYQKLCVAKDNTLLSLNTQVSNIYRIKVGARVLPFQSLNFHYYKAEIGARVGLAPHIKPRAAEGLVFINGVTY